MNQRVNVSFLVAACVACLDWTRLSGTVKGINLKDSTVTIQDHDGDLLTVPVDYQVKVIEKHGELRTLRNIQLDEKITLTKTPMEKPPETDDSTGMAQPEPTQRGK